MIAEKVIGNLTGFDLAGRQVDPVKIEWYELDKKLLRKATASGEEIGIRVQESLHDGDILFTDDKRIVSVDVQATDLTCITVKDMKSMGRLCFELGNRHLSLSIEEGEVRVPYDEPTFQYLEKLGFLPLRRIEKFTNFTVCHAHSHSHAGEMGTAHEHKTEHGHD